MHGYIQENTSMAKQNWYIMSSFSHYIQFTLKYNLTLEFPMLVLRPGEIANSFNGSADFNI